MVVCSSSRAQAGTAACCERLATMAVATIVGHACADPITESQDTAHQPWLCTSMTISSSIGIGAQRTERVSDSTVCTHARTGAKPCCEGQTSIAHLNISVGACRVLVGVEGLRGVVLLRRARSSRSRAVLVAPKPAALWLASSGACACACTCLQESHCHAFDSAQRGAMQMMWQLQG